MLAKGFERLCKDLVVSVTEGPYAGDEAGAGGRHEDRDHTEHDRRRPSRLTPRKLPKTPNAAPTAPADTLALAPRSTKRMPPAPKSSPTTRHVEGATICCAPTSATHSKTDVVGLAQQVPVLLAGTTSLIGPRVGRVETDERTRLTVSARASVRCRRRPRGARR
jgi:hypothetical protein